MNNQPNFVYFVADQMRADALHHFGNQASITPNLDALSQEGVSFRNAYCQNPVCVPSRNSFLSGLYPHTTGHRTMHFLQGDDDPNILKVMKASGYEVIWIGRNDVVPANKSKIAYCDEFYDGNSFENQVNELLPVGPTTYGVIPEIGPDLYSFYVGLGDENSGFLKYDWICLQNALNYLERKAKSDNKKPFFLYITLTFPHPPYACEEPWYSSIDRSKLPTRRPDVRTLKDKPSMLHQIASKQGLEVWNEEKFDELRATYLAMTSRFDYQYGVLVSKLKELNFYNESNIFVFSDHGDYTTDYGVAEKAQNLFHDPVCNVPLLVKPSKNFTVKPGVSNALVELTDLSATVAEMASIELPYTQFGKSLVDAISGSSFHKDAVICEGGRIHGEKQAMELGHKESSPYWPRLSTQYSEGPEHGKAIMIRMGNQKYTFRLYEKDELYDLEKDPFELKNVIDAPEYKESIQRFKDRLLKLMVETGDFVPNRRDKR